MRLEQVYFDLPSTQRQVSHKIKEFSDQIDRRLSEQLILGELRQGLGFAYNLVSAFLAGPLQARMLASNSQSQQKA
jgi:hypothetical protein